ncbi:MAG: hypothetical protein OS112_06575 [Methanoregula sp.]|nr:MAG: hypothetical protein OS112_06575 [Methanoregula sp.]
MQSRILVTLVTLVILSALIAFAGCTGTQAPPMATSTPGSGTTAGQSAAPLVTSPTDVMPDYNMVSVTVGVKEYTGSIPVTFDGGKGMNAATKVDVKLTRADGSVQTYTLGTRKGDEVELAGTRGSGSERGQADRVEVWVTMNTGQTYKVADVLREYRSRG